MSDQPDESWVVRLCRRDNEDKWYFIDKKSNINARLSSAAHYTKEVATQFAEAINTGNIDYLATPRKLYSDGKLWHKPDDQKENSETIATSVTVTLLPDGKQQKGTSMPTLSLKFKKLSPDATLPKFAHENDSGMDVGACESVQILPRSFAKVNTGIAAVIPEGYELQVRPRSGLQCKRGIVAGFGTVDQGYRGEIGVALYNHSDEPFVVNVGDRIAQLVLAPVVRPVIEETTADLDPTDRGTDGFGSTGK